MSCPQGCELFYAAAVFAQHNAVVSYLRYWDIIRQKNHKQY